MTQTIVTVPEGEGGGGGKMGEGDFFKANASGSLTIDFSNGYYQEFTLTGNITALAFSADSGVDPTPSTGANDIDRIAFDSINDSGSTTVFGHVLGLDMQ